MKKQLIALLLALITLVSVTPITGLAASDEATQAAQALYELGLFQGTGVNVDGTPNFDLDRTPTRHEAVTMLVRLLGKNEEAKNGTWTTPFTDVDEWAKPYVGYAYTNGLTTGTSETTFGGANPIDAPQYLTFALRALGYESGKDFQWDKAWEKSDSIGLTNGNYNSSTTSFTRGDVAIISQKAIEIKDTPAPADTHLDAPVVLSVDIDYSHDVLGTHSFPRVKWRVVANAESYELWYKAGEYGEWTNDTLIGATKSTMLRYAGDTVSGIRLYGTAGITYFFKVRAYKTEEDGTKVFSDFSNEVSIVYPEQPEREKEIKVKIKRVK